MILLVSHYTKNRGVTDFLIQHLENKKIPFLYLKHPFYFEDKKVSELVCINTEGEQKVLLTARKSKVSLLSMIQDFFINIIVSLKMGKKVDKIIGFGSFNMFPFIITNWLYKRNLYFWGCDYSVKRFKSRVLNRIYFWFETVACKHSTLIIQPTIRQQLVREEKHGLDINKSLIIPNGIESFEGLGMAKESKEIALIYIGSITKQHGVTEFVRYFYAENKIPFKLFIFGSGEDELSLVDLIKEKSLFGMVTYFGSKNAEEIKYFIKNFKGRFFGIAPYNKTFADHVYYGDSIKIKEYLSYGIPYITSEVSYLNPDIKEFGFVYSDYPALLDFFNKKIDSFTFDEENRIKVLKNYVWYHLLDNFLLKANI